MMPRALARNRFALTSRTTRDLGIVRYSEVLSMTTAPAAQRALHAHR